MNGATQARTSPTDGEGGFVLLLVLFVVATLTVTVSGTLLVTQSDYQTARAGVGATRAFHLAQAGINRYMGERTTPADSVLYSMGGGTVIVRAARVAVHGTQATWEISSSATLPSTSGSVERRTVRQLAVLQAGAPTFRATAAVATTARNVRLSGHYSGYDQAAAGSCPAATGTALAGLAAVAGGYLDTWSSSLSGSPRISTEADTAAMRLRLDARWAQMLNPSTPFQYEVPTVGWPNFASIPANVYPTIRVRGDLTATSAQSGRGLLVIEGRLNLGTGFTWNGVIMAGDLVYPTSTNANIRGAFIVGLNQNASTSVDIRPSSSAGSARIVYDACEVAAASPAGPSTFTLLANTWSEPAQ